MSNLIKARTASHSDVANSEPAKAHQAELTERAFGQALVAHLRAANGGEVRLRNLREEWIKGDDGVAHELTAELVTAE